jgi:hypothetical protein
MKRSFFLAALLGAACLTQSGRADEDQAGPTQDLTPTALRVRRVAAEDFNGGQLTRISVLVKNVGSLVVRGSRGGVTVGGLVNPRAPLYGPNGVGGYNLGAPIRPGETGMFLIETTAGAVRHCQSVRVQIDTAHSLQSGTTLVFYNDTKNLTAIDPSSIKVCIGGVFKP